MGTLPDGEAVVFTTARLAVLPRWRDVDRDAYAAMNADPDVMEHLSAALTREQSDAFADYGDEGFARDGYGLLPVVRRSDGVTLGMCGMHRHRWYPDDVEVGWRFARHAWGHGYATEAAAGWLRRGFTELGLPRVISITTPSNVRSIAVMRRLGMSFDHSARHLTRDGSELDVVVHALTAERWRAAAADAAGAAPDPSR